MKRRPSASPEAPVSRIYEVRNAEWLRQAGVTVVDPDEGPMACGGFGPGRLPEPPAILRAIADKLDLDIEVPGLPAPDRGGEWLDVPYIPGSFAVNSGDILQRWSNGRFKSTPHRALPPVGTDRYAIPFFFGPRRMSFGFRFRTVI